jgi:hypothetical protein
LAGVVSRTEAGLPEVALRLFCRRGYGQTINVLPLNGHPTSINTPGDVCHLKNSPISSDEEDEKSSKNCQIKNRQTNHFAIFWQIDILQFFVPQIIYGQFDGTPLGLSLTLVAWCCTARQSCFV